MATLEREFYKMKNYMETKYGYCDAHNPLIMTTSEIINEEKKDNGWDEEEQYWLNLEMEEAY